MPSSVLPPPLKSTWENLTSKNFLIIRIMLAHYFFENMYTRTFLAFLLCVILTFVHEIEALKQTWLVVCLFIVTMLMVLSNLYNDYGLVLLTLALFILAYNNVRNTRKAN